MTELAERIQQTLRENRQLVQESKERARKRRLAVQRSNMIVERALGRLRRAGVIE